MNNGACIPQKCYSFTENEYEEMTKLFFVLQKDITSAENLPAKTKSRLIDKLEEMIIFFESEVENLDIFWSFIARSEIAFKVYNGQIVPDSLKEFAGIIWQVQCRIEGRAQNSNPPIRF